MNGRAAESLAKDIVDQLLALTNRATGRAPLGQAGDLAQSVAKRLGVEAPELEDQYADALLALGVLNTGWTGPTAPELTHASRQRSQPATKPAAESGSADSGASAVGGKASETGEGSGGGQNVDVAKLADLVYWLMKEDLSVEIDRTRRFHR